MGVVIRDNEGNFIAGHSKKLHVPLGAIEIEAKAFEARIVFVGEIGILYERLIQWSWFKHCVNLP